VCRCMRVNVCVCMYISICVYVIHTCVYIHVRAAVRAVADPHVYTFMSAERIFADVERRCACVCMYVCVSVYLCVSVTYTYV